MHQTTADLLGSTDFLWLPVLKYFQVTFLGKNGYYLPLCPHQQGGAGFSEYWSYGSKNFFRKFCSETLQLGGLLRFHYHCKIPRVNGLGRRVSKMNDRQMKAFQQTLRKELKVSYQIRSKLLYEWYGIIISQNNSWIFKTNISQLVLQSSRILYAGKILDCYSS